MTAESTRRTRPTLPAGGSHARNWRGLGGGFLLKLALMALVNALGVSVVLSAIAAESWIILAVSVVLLVAADVIYFTRRALPLKYLFPGLVFLLAFQVFTLGYTGYVAFTNYGTGHAGSQQQAVDAALIQAERRLDDSPSYPLAVVQRGDELGFAINDDGRLRVGTAEQPLRDAGALPDSSSAPASVPGWDVVPRALLLGDAELQEQVASLRVPISADANDGSLRTREGSTAAVYRSSLVWDEQAQTITDVDSGVVYTADPSTGNFVAADGSTLPTGWIVTVGFDNFLRAFTDQRYSVPLLQVTGWTFAFAALTVFTSFALGLFLAIVFNDERVRARRVLRTLFLFPYAFPAFMSALLWRGMLNSEFGIVNDLFFFGADINWLGDPWLARLAVIWVNLWLSFPYWFLVCLGALQSLPGETLEAATIDGAGPWRRFRSITLPLLLVSTAPLAIASFAFNFNNFTIIYMLTSGGPYFTGGAAQLGATDLLISAIYKISGVAGGTADYGLASALSIIVFLVIGAISALAFRQTRKLEEIQS
ncbi:ABC transporter permease subunit [Protaetiibacter intestinalis]|uniref:Maltose/maltodextrin transport system permease protein n=1 Tax=Protaetiibacter intestinalis TaxID=2419774 RepID=A0A387B643_9MICO|nr:ABC transporter permease subunit [Protaetiibacter intestinalis]AYF97807.1 ABC transporter permease subunit [Protaetiibacter intestinalis]